MEHYFTYETLVITTLQQCNMLVSKERYWRVRNSRIQIAPQHLLRVSPSIFVNSKTNIAFKNYCLQ